MTNEYISISDLQSYFVDKDTGAPLAGGYVQFWVDSERTTAKLVYQKVNVGADSVTGEPVYEFEPLPNPVQLSGVGTPQDDNGNDITVYYYPYDDEGNVELYYVAIFSYLGVPQFTREGVPNSFATDNPGATGATGNDNQISNPQFMEVLFNPDEGLQIAFTGSGTKEVEIAPDWLLQIVHTNTGTLDVARIAVTGSSNRATNPPYVLSITPGSNISALNLIQNLPNTPGLWAPQETGVNGYVAANFVLGAGSQSVVMKYSPSVGVATTLLEATNSSDEYVEYSDSVQLPPSANTSDADSGYVDIVINLATTTVTLISSIQVIPTNEEITGVLFEQDTKNRQIDHLFHYYKPELEYKPIPNLLDAWDFPLNPAQLFSSTVAASAIGANKSKYVWDQTIIFQSANSGVGVTRATDGSLVLTAAATTQMGLIQYQEALRAKNILQGRLSVCVRVATSAAQNFTVSLWATTDASLPDLAPGTNNSLVLTLDANGKPATFNGTWTEVSRSNLDDAVFETDDSNEYVNFKFNGWENTALSQTATFFAIVIGTDSVTSTETVTFNSVNLCQGDIATIPAAQSASAVLQDCQWWYEKSFELTTAAATGVTVGEFIFAQTAAGGDGNTSPTVVFKTRKRNASYTATIYNPVSANSQAYNFTSASDCSSTTVAADKSTGSFRITTTTPGGSVENSTIGFQWSADNRLGITA